MCKKISKMYVIHILRNENNLFFTPLSQIAWMLKKKVKRIISFNTALISQLNLSIEIMCQMA